MFSANTRMASASARCLVTTRISVSIDDFGTGYSALGCLGKYSFDRIKIDKSLVDEISEGDGKHMNVIQAAINMAHATGMQAIAEGVERQEQLDILTELGCDQIQGYLFGRPVPADIFEQKYIGALLSEKRAGKGLKTPKEAGVSVERMPVSGVFGKRHE